MPFELPPLPYARDALAPLISQETLDYHYGKHHNAYVTNLNNLVVGTEFEKGSRLEDIILQADGPLFNNAAQVWNHSFYWRCLSPDGGGEPAAELLAAIEAAFGSFAAFKQQFSTSAAGNFGSGWTWLVKQKDGALAIVNTANAGNPMTDGLIPLLTCDVWEHAYYIDYRNARPAYIEAFWKLVNWEFAAANLAA
ncbi:superoxide dismutase [Mariprofundus ferrooxydans]|jgi:Fe-Mn family superoxide dismutase|uniref:Superoxide dismutase n=1 Tax=Mariprofundus ferrooxydans PV-1 TaxID=314345 RepID=Q0F1P3_9PROT|nr:Fe-Mn family superoxide dismutase [Mariprofundus ferrooxydans]EAU55148.1 superoxide dismutase [Mariprofundus ferrooxydans PV-1]KON47593.1 superoxide dismutase [Mariprofundus ferrooxydans]